MSAPRDGFPPRLLGVLFFASGAAALVYQLVWQRVLFQIYGSDIVSVTVVVTAFLLGLGIGSLLGGVVSRVVRPERLVPLFALVELGIGLYGFASLGLFQWVGGATAGGSHFMTGLLAFALVLLPTLLMGATLPLLTAYLTWRWNNVGRSVGGLYCVNTLGSAAASLLTSLVLLGALGRSGSTLMAGGLNVAVALAVLLAWRSTAGAAGESA